MRVVRLILPILFIFVATAFLASDSLAQLPPVSSTTSTPIPGAGHDYLGTVNETVNPATGSVSIRISVIIPPARGITLPFSFAYDSNAAQWLKLDRSQTNGTGTWRVLAHYLREWLKQTPYAKPTDFVFPSIKESGRVPICASVFCADHLRPAAKKAGVVIPDGHRWGLHNLRHSLSNWLVNKAKENPKTVQGILGHSRIQTTLDLYTDEDLDEMIAAQEKFLDAVGFDAGSVQ